MSMKDYDIAVLNDVMTTLMDSRNGYKTCSNLVGNAHPLNRFFLRRIKERESLVVEMQTAVESYGSVPEGSSSFGGTIHRVVTHFSSVFRGEEKAALAALQNGEDFLAEKIAERLEDEKIGAEARTLLKKALASARDGERLAVQLSA